MQTALQEKTMLIAFLKAENQQLSARLQELTQKYEQELQSMNEQGMMLQMELEQRDNLLQVEREQREQENHREFDNTRSVQENTRSAQENPRHLAAPPMKRSDNSQMLLERSRMESFDNNSRVMELEMHIGKLNSELNLRD
jgi:acetylornithine/succinyldiaminopimelate/putrescine aminotransferase